MGLNVLTKIYTCIIIISLKNVLQGVYTGMSLHHSVTIPGKEISCKYNSRKIWKCSIERCSKTRKIGLEKTKSAAGYQLFGDLSRGEGHAYIFTISVGKVL